MDRRTLLKVEDIAISYGAAVVVDGVSLEVQEHEIVGVFGANGAGKSSLLKGIVGLVRPVRGLVQLGGEDVSRLDTEGRARRGIILVPEGRGIFAPLTVEENLLLGAYPSGRIPRAEFARRREEAFDLFPVLGERRRQLAGTLSGGEAAMLAVARGLMSNPRLLILDEPSLGLAPAATARLFERLGTLKASNMGILVVEQKAAQLMDLVDRSLVMRQGRSEHWGDGAIDLSDLDRMYFGATT